ncbi:hypothetical protein B0O99DRAFT_491003, partial [Bisporella sp. PMI_857]
SSRHSSPANGLRAPPAPEAPKESVVSRLFIAPLTFISFLFSLALIDWKNNSTRTHYHPANAPPPTTIFGRVKTLFHFIIFKPSSASNPYAYVRVSEKAGGDNKNSKSWHWHTKQRKMMKAEFVDAFKIRKIVLALLAAI